MAPFLTPAKTINIVKCLFDLAARRRRCAGRPFMYRIDPCSACNLACVSCKSWSARLDEPRMMTLGDFQTILEKIEDVAVRVSLYDGGEPLLNKNVYQMIRLASAARISTNISTNFNLFEEDDAEALFESGLTVLEPCLDGFTQEAYAKYRVKGDVERVKQGIKTVMTEKRRRRSRHPFVDVQVIAFEHLKNEIPLIDAFLRETGVDKVTYRQDILGFDAASSTAERATAQPVKPALSSASCFWLYFGMMVKPNGKVYPCCGGDFHTFPFGDLTRESLDEIWNNGYYRFARSLFTGDESVPYDNSMAKIPCLRCNLYKIRRRVKRPADDRASSQVAARTSDGEGQEARTAVR